MPVVARWVGEVEGRPNCVPAVPGVTVPEGAVPVPEAPGVDPGLEAFPPAVCAIAALDTSVATRIANVHIHTSCLIIVSKVVRDRTIYGQRRVPGAYSPSI